MMISEMLNLTRDYIDEPVAQNWTDATLVRFINLRQQQLASEITHTYQDFFQKVVQLNNGVGTIAGVELYTLPNDFIKFKRIERGDTQETIEPLDLNEKVINYSPFAPSAFGTIAGYYELDNNVGFTPTPQSAIPVNMTYTYRLPDMDLVTQTTSAIPAEFHHLMSIGASIDAFIKDESDTSELRAEWNAGIARLNRTLRERQAQGPRHVRRVNVDPGQNWRVI